MARYRKKPVEIEAMQFTDLMVLDECAGFCAGRYGWVGEGGNAACAVGDPNAIFIDTLEGVMTARLGDWIIRGVKGEFYPCKPDIFDATYEPVVDGGVNESDEITPKEPYPEGGTRRQIREWRYRNEPCTVCCRPPKDGHIPGKDCGGYGKDV